MPRCAIGVSLALAIILGCGAARQAPTPEQIRIRPAEAVKSCTPVGMIEERIESATDDSTLDDQVARSMRRRASELGATDVVILRKEVDAIYAAIEAEAYRCER